MMRSAICALLAAVSTWSQAQANEGSALRGDLTSHRQLISNTDCLGSTLEVRGTIHPNESICASINSEMVYFGIWTYPMPGDPGYTMYRVELKSDFGTYSRGFSGIGTQGDPPIMTLQGDGNLVFGGQGFSSCIVMPGRSPRRMTMVEDDENDLALNIVDSEGQIIWQLLEPGCYPFVEETCLPALFQQERLSWKQYICTHDTDGTVLYKFGLSPDAGLFGLWHQGSLVWRPKESRWVRGDYLHLQADGHLTVYRDTSPRKTYTWTSDDCIDYTASKLVLTSDGDVQELNHAGAIVWALLGSQHQPEHHYDARDSVPELCMPQTQCAVSPSTPLFIIEEDVDIGDTLIRPGPAFADSCGPRCYDVKDNGDDPPYDPEWGDTLRFAYKSVSSNQFTMRAKVCGTMCDDHDWTWADDVLGRAGLMVRENLDPFAKNIFVSHQPHYQADWSYRSETNANSTYGYDGSPDVECLWITLQRQSHDTFSFHYNYESYDDPECTPNLDWTLLDTTVTVDMPEDVLLGLAVSTGVAPPFCRFTQARFSEIQLDMEP